MTDRYRKFFGEIRHMRTFTNQLCTVMYDFECAFYFAFCRLQLATDSEITHVLAAEILRRDTYVYDILSGTDEISIATKKMMQQFNDILTASGFNFKKWIANSPNLFADILIQEKFLVLTLGDTASITRSMEQNKW